MNISINDVNISINEQPKILTPLERLYQQQQQQKDYSILISNSQETNSTSILIERGPSKVLKLPQLTQNRIQGPLIQQQNEQELTKKCRRAEKPLKKRVSRPTRAQVEPQQQLPPETPIERPFLLNTPISPFRQPIREPMPSTDSPHLQLPKLKRRRI